MPLESNSALLNDERAKDVAAPVAVPEPNGFVFAGARAVDALLSPLLAGPHVARRPDASELRRMLADAMRAWPGEPAAMWSKWLVETCRACGRAARQVDAPLIEIHELLRHGVEAATFIEGGRLIVLTEARGRRYRVVDVAGEGDGEGEAVWLSERRLSGLISRRPAATQRWVLIDPLAEDSADDSDHDNARGGAGDPSHGGHGGAAHGASQGSGEHHHPTPYARLRAFMQPERADVLIVLVFAVFIGTLMLATPIAVEALVNTVAFGMLLQPLIVLSVILLACLGFAASLRFLQKVVAEILQQRLFARVAARLAWQLPRAKVNGGQDFGPELINRFFDVVTVQKVVAQLLLDGLTVVLTVALGMIVLAFYHPWLLAFDLALLVLLAIDVGVLSRGAVKTSIAESRRKYAVAGWLEEIARCAVTFKTGGAAEFAMARADALTGDYLVARQTHFRILRRQILGGLAIEAVASAALLALGGVLVMRGQMTLGQLVAAELIVTAIVVSVAKFEKHLEAWYDLMASMDKLGHLFDMPTERPMGLMHLPLKGAPRVTIDRVSFDFGEGGGSGGTAIEDLSLNANPGEIVAVCGPPGSGKSTLLELLFRLREPTAGRLSIGDVDLADVRVDVLRRRVALARGHELLAATLAENVHLGRAEVGVSEVRSALAEAGLGERRRDGSPWPLQTLLSPTGAPLSETEVRRLVLARALASRPQLLLIDGLLDGLPDEEALALLASLRSRREERTIVLVTARKALAESCDRVWELQGK